VSTDWQPGDVAFCVRGDWVHGQGNVPFLGPVKGDFLIVEEVGFTHEHTILKFCKRWPGRGYDATGFLAFDRMGDRERRDVLTDLQYLDRAAERRKASRR